jgi:hypothetical protein
MELGAIAGLVQNAADIADDAEHEHLRGNRLRHSDAPGLRRSDPTVMIAPQS